MSSYYNRTAFGRLSLALASTFASTLSKSTPSRVLKSHHHTTRIASFTLPPSPLSLQSPRVVDYSIMQTSASPTSATKAKITTTTTTTTTPDSNSINPNDDVKKLKKNLRRQIRASLKTLSPSSLSTQSSTVWTKLFLLPEYKTSNSVGFFLSMPQGEIDTREACRRVLRDGKALYVPRVGLDFENPTMVMTRVVGMVGHDGGNDGVGSDTMPYDDWPKNRWGIPEAPHSNEEELHPIAKPGDIDLLVVPGLAFDRFGSRLGQGKGYYDRFISDITTTTTTTTTTVTTTAAAPQEEGDEDTARRPLLVAVGLEPSFVDGDCIPVAEYDVPMDRLVVPHRETMVFQRR